MAIKSIIKDIKQTLRTSEKNRIEQYKQAKIRFIFSKKYVVQTVQQLILDTYANTPAVKKSLVGKGAVKYSETERANLEKYIKLAFDKVFSVKNISDEHRRLGYAVSRTQKQAKEIANRKGRDGQVYSVAIYKTGEDVTAIYFSSFYGNKQFAVKTKQMASSDTGDVQNVLVRNLMNECIDETINGIRTRGVMKRVPFGLGGDKPIVGAATLKATMQREGGYRRRVHGEPPGNQTGGSDTTVASVSLIEYLQTEKDAILSRAQKASKLKRNTVLNKIFEEIVDGTTAKLVIKRKAMSDAIKHNQQIEIVMTLANDDVNKLQGLRADRNPLLAAATQIEKDLIKKFKDPDYTASKSPRKRLVEVGSKAIVQNMFPHKSTPDMRYRVNRQLLAAGKRETLNDQVAQAIALTKASVSGRKQTKGKGARTKKGYTAGRVEQQAGSNPMALRNLLNELLPQVVAKNMTAPALQYRTGRFANSVRVEDVTQGPRGGNTMIEASYMTDPYSTFAPGGRKHTPQRDPEKLIARSVREIATGMIGARFGVRVQ